MISKQDILAIATDDINVTFSLKVFGKYILVYGCCMGFYGRAY